MTVPAIEPSVDPQKRLLLIPHQLPRPLTGLSKVPGASWDTIPSSASETETAMAWSIHHVNLAANDVRQTAKFYTEILGLTEGTWVFPPAEQIGHISADPAKLTIFPTHTQAHGENPGLHLIKPEPGFARGNNLDHNPSIGGHVAFQVDNLDDVIERLKSAGIAYSLTGTFAIPGMRHLYVYDPSMNLIEVNEMVKT